MIYIRLFLLLVVFDFLVLVLWSVSDSFIYFDGISQTAKHILGDAAGAIVIAAFRALCAGSYFPIGAKTWAEGWQRSRKESIRRFKAVAAGSLVIIGIGFLVRSSDLMPLLVLLAYLIVYPHLVAASLRADSDNAIPAS